MLGIIIGVGAVIIIMSVGAGAQSLILSQVQSLGSNLLSISPGHAEEGDIMASFSNFAVTTLSYEDMVYLQDNRNAPNIAAVAAYNKGFGAAKWKSNTYDTALNGTTADYLKVEGSELSEGRFFIKEEERGVSRIAIIGSAVKRELFGMSDALGQNIKINDISFEVIGVLKERGMVALEDYDDQILLPLKTTQRMMGVNHVGLIRARVDEEKNINQAKSDIKILLREQHDIRDKSGKSDDFSVGSSAQTLDLVSTITDGLRYFLAAMAALSLIAGGIGIMNIMLISVTERTREIGLRKAVGAKNRDILIHFLAESIFITLFGGTIGLVIGIFISWLIAFGVQLAGYEWSFIVTPVSIGLALVVSAGVGLVFGFFPARKAGKFDPIIALQYE